MAEKSDDPRQVLTEWLTAEHSKVLAQRIATIASTDEGFLAALMQIIFSADYRLCQRAAWSLTMIADRKPEVLEKWLPEMAAQLHQPRPDAVHRNIVRVLQNLEIPVSLHGVVADACFRFIADPQTAVAIRAFAMTVLEKIVRQSPELRNELALLLQEGLQVEEKPAFRSRARKILHQLKIKNLE